MSQYAPSLACHVEAPNGELSGYRTRHLMSNTAAEDGSVVRTLGIPELLELILLNLPVRSIAHAQQVCSQWRNAIAGSKALPESLHFLRPAAPIAASSNGGCIVVLNPIFTVKIELPYFDHAARDANHLLERTSGFFGIPFPPDTLMDMNFSDPLLQLISQPPTKSVSITRHWTRRVGRISEEDNDPEDDEI